MYEFLWFLAGAALGSWGSEVVYKPFVALRRLRTDIAVTLQECSGYFITMPATIDPLQRQAASEAIYRHASRIRPLLKDAPLYPIFRHVFRLPSHERFAKAEKPLTQLANFHAQRTPTEVMLLGHYRQDVCDLLDRPVLEGERRSADEKARLMELLRQR